MVFIEGVTNKSHVGKLKTHNAKIVTKIFTLVDKCARVEEFQNRTV